MLLHKASEALDLLTEAAPVERFASLRRDLAALYAGYYIAELLTDLTDFHDPHPKLFDAATITLRHLGDPELRPRRVLRFELACLRELGLMPALDAVRPLRRGRSTRRGDVVAFGLATGGRALPGLPARPAARRRPSRARTLEAIRVLASPGSGWRELDLEPRARRSPPVRADPRGGHQPPPGPSPPTPALSGSLTRWPWLPGAPTRADRSRARSPDRIAGPGGRPRSGRARTPSPVRGRAGLRPRGCQSFSVPFAQWRAAYDPRPGQEAHQEETADVREGRRPANLLQRWLTPAEQSRTQAADAPTSDSPSTLILGSDGWQPMLKPEDRPRGRQAEFAEAMKLFQQGKLAEAEKPPSPRSPRTARGPPGARRPSTTSPRRQYQRKKYVDAHDSYEKLIADYPGTEYLDKLVSREYEIAQIWLAQADPKAKPEQKLPWYARFNGQQPLIDTRGTGLKALEHVRHHDPTGPLADDAVLRIADEHMSQRRLRVGRPLLRPAHHRPPQEPVPPERPARRDRRPDQGLHRPRVRRRRPGEGPRADQADHGHLPRPAGRATRSSTTPST